VLFVWLERDLPDGRVPLPKLLQLAGLLLPRQLRRQRRREHRPDHLWSGV